MESPNQIEKQTGPLDLDLAHVADSFQQIQAFQALVRGNMKPGHDYGTIPGTQRPTLLKPGAEKITKLMGLADSYSITEKIENWDKPLFSYTITCELRSIQTGNLVAQGLGHANSMEARYRYRWAWSSDVPAGLDKNTLPTRQINTRRGRSTQYRIENDDVFSLVNTLLKMAKKRALVDAALSAGRLSELFGQADYPEQHHENTRPDFDPSTGEVYDTPFSEQKAGLLSKIQTILTEHWPERDDESQHAKTSVLSSVYGKGSWREIEALPTHFIEAGLNSLPGEIEKQLSAKMA